MARILSLGEASGISENDYVLVDSPTLGSRRYKAKNFIGGDPVLITKNITANGTYDASADNADGYSDVIVNVEISAKVPAVRVWTESTSGYTASMFVQKGTYDMVSAVFTGEGNPTSVPYQSVPTKTTFFNMVSLVYSGRWNCFSATTNLSSEYGHVLNYDEKIKEWTYDATIEFLVISVPT